MLVKKSGIPTEDEVVLCTITKVHSHGVFARLDEYDNQSGLIHISEISPGRIRNIREFVSEGKVVVCKVLRINTERGHIDLSLRRVNESLRRKKLDDIKKLAKAERIIIESAKTLDLDPKDLYSMLYNALSDDYESFYDAFVDIVEGSLTLTEYGIDDNISNKISEIVVDKIKPEYVTIRGQVKMISYIGLEDLKSYLNKIDEIPNVKLWYSGGGKYTFEITDDDYKAAEEKYDMIDHIVSEADNHKDREVMVSRIKK
ncbi:MAG: S1 RNA-binding domain-containing protein [Candidatus Woesearchaeota archaeon]